MENITSMYPGLFRAIEIAKLGNHSISLHHSSDYITGGEDSIYLFNFYKDVFSKFSNNGDMKVEIVKPYDYFSKDKSLTLKDLQENVLKAKSNKKPVFVLDNTKERLLKSAIERLELSLKSIDTIKDVSCTIAQLDGANNVELHHIAEAIQYSFDPTEC